MHQGQTPLNALLSNTPAHLDARTCGPSNHGRAHTLPSLIFRGVRVGLVWDVRPTTGVKLGPVRNMYKRDLRYECIEGDVD